MSLRPACAAFLAASLCAATAFAQGDAERAQARELGERGGDALDEKRFDKALDLFQRADKLFHAPTLTLGLARALAGTGKLTAALEVYERLAHDGVGPKPVPAFVTAVAEGKREAKALEARVAHAILEVVPAEASVRVDGQIVVVAGGGTEQRVDPGHHVAEATAPGYAPKKTLFDVPEGGHVLVTIALDAGAPAATSASSAADGAAHGADRATPGDSSAQRPLGIALIGAGAASLLAGVITGGLAVAKKSDLDTACGPTHVCSSSESGALDAYRTVATASTATLVAGAVLAGVGVVVLVMAPRRDGAATQARLGPRVTTGLRGAGVELCATPRGFALAGSF